MKRHANENNPLTILVPLIVGCIELRSCVPSSYPYICFPCQLSIRITPCHSTNETATRHAIGNMIQSIVTPSSFSYLVRLRVASCLHYPAVGLRLIPLLEDVSDLLDLLELVESLG